MSDEKPVEPKSADELIKTKPGNVELSESELGNVAGGTLAPIDIVTIVTPVTTTSASTGGNKQGYDLASNKVV